jgi:uncharacterized protein (DUF433 family)
MDWRDYVHSDLEVLAGKPVVKGTRLAVEFLLGLLGAGWTQEQILENYPSLTPEALQAVCAFAADSLRPTRLRLEKPEDLRSFFASCDSGEKGHEPDWEEHLGNLERSRRGETLES